MTKYTFNTGEVAESIAIALSIGTGIPVTRSQVIVEPSSDDNAGQYLVTVYNTTEFASQVIAFMDENGSIPASLGDLHYVGNRTNRQLATMDLRQHGQIIGATTSGKSSLLHVMVAAAARCPDCFIFVGGVWKLYDFVSSWIEPYLDTGVEPPIKWVAHGQADVCEMMASYLRMANYRLNLRMDKRAGLPYGILILDEVTYIVGNRLTRANVNGEEMSASAMLAGIARGTAGARQYMWLATQRDTQDNLGDEGGTTAAQMGFNFIFRINDVNAIGRVTNDYTLAVPRNRGQCWANLGPGSQTLSLRIPYPQANDPLKPVLHNGPKVSDIAWARRGISHDIDPGSEDALGEAYANRHKLVTDAYIDYLTKPPRSTSTNAGVTTVVNAPISVGGFSQSELEEAERIYQQMVESHLTNSSNGHSNGDGSHVAVLSAQPQALDLSQHTTQTARVLAICRHNEVPQSRSDIIDTLRAHGFEVSDPQVITNILTKLTKSDPPQLQRTEDGRYYPA